MGGPELAVVPTRPPRAFIWRPALPRACGFVNLWVSGISLGREVSPSGQQLMRRQERPGRGVAARRVVRFLGDRPLGSGLPKPRSAGNAAPGPGRVVTKCDYSFLKPLR